MGFEPTVGLLLHSISNAAPSTTRTTFLNAIRETCTHSLVKPSFLRCVQFWASFWQNCFFQSALVRVLAVDALSLRVHESQRLNGFYLITVPPTLSTQISKYFSSFSIPMYPLFKFFAASGMLPTPMQLSRTISPSSE